MPEETPDPFALKWAATNGVSVEIATAHLTTLRAWNLLDQVRMYAVVSEPRGFSDFLRVTEALATVVRAAERSIAPLKLPFLQAQVDLRARTLPHAHARVLEICKRLLRNIQSYIGGNAQRLTDDWGFIRQSLRSIPNPPKQVVLECEAMLAGTKVSASKKPAEREADDDWAPVRWFTKNTGITSDDLRQARKRDLIAWDLRRKQFFYRKSEANMRWSYKWERQGVTKSGNKRK